MRQSIYTFFYITLLTLSFPSFAETANLPPATTAAPATQAMSSQDKMAIYQDLSIKFNNEAMKIPAYSDNIKAMQNILTKVAACQMSGGNPQTCADEHRAELEKIGKDTLKIVKDSINSGNTSLKAAYDNLNSFAKANNFKALE